ncbi:hypothetical protein BH11VER1_BH11VER1_03750 [soil metagenome]
MNEAPPPMPAPKKGLSGLAIAGIGCGGLTLLVLLVMVLLGMKACSKLKEVAGDFKANPEKAAAMMVLKFNPELDIINTDDAKGEITVRNKKSGEVVTLSFKDISEGKFSMKNAKGETVSIDGSDAAGKGGIVMKGPEGEVVIGGTDAKAIAPPAWVPMYPNLKSQPGGMRSEKNGAIAGAFAAETTDAATAVKEFYEAKLKEAGFETNITTTGTGGGEFIIIHGTKDDDKSQVSAVISSKDGKTGVMINYEEKK